MHGFYLYGSIIAPIFLYINIIITIKKIKNDKEITLNNILGSFSIIFFFICIYSLF